MSSSETAGSTAADGFFRRNLPTLNAWAGNLGWPILLKQLRMEFRKNRFFYSHLACLTALGATLLLIITTNASDLTVTPTQIGQEVFNWFFIIQFFVVLVIFPAFSATAFTEERSNLSLDFLLISTLSPEEIVWGKFLASTLYCFLYIMATVPLLAISFLFGGVTVADVLLAYAILVGLTLLVSMTSLCLSSCFEANIRATFSVYTIVLGALLYAIFFLWAGIDQAWEANPNQTILAASESQWGFSGDTAWLQWSIIALDLVALFVFLFLVTANRIRPPADDHSSKLRVLVLLYLPLRVLAGFYETFGDAAIYGRGVGQAEILEGMRGMIRFVAAFLFIATVTFSTEESDVSRRCRQEFSSFTGPRYVLRLFAPGAFWGFWYSVVLGVVCCVGLCAVFTFHLGDLASAETVLFVREALATLPLYVAGFGALGFLLSVCGFTPLYSRLTVTFIFIITALLPMIFYISEAKDEVWNFYYMSPLVLWESLDYLVTAPREDQIQFRIGNVHIIDVTKGVFLVLAVTFVTISCIRAHRTGLPLLRFRTR